MVRRKRAEAEASMQTHRGFSRQQRLASLIVLPLAGGCSGSALLQTAHTEPTKNLRMVAGLTAVKNELTSGERPLIATTSGELAGRFGLTSSLDVGLEPLMTYGLAADAKLNLMLAAEALALAPRLRLGAAGMSDDGFLGLGSADSTGSVWLAEAGFIASYRLQWWLEPYAGVSLANHWLFDYPREDSPTLEANQSYADAEGYGDGVVKLSLGLEASLNDGFGIIAEYGFWKSAQNDPGDGFAFVDNHLFALAMRF